MTSPRLLIALLVPLLGLLAAGLWPAWQLRDGRSWTVPIEGFDPRDLLRGHYITVRYLAQADNGCTDQPCVLCLLGDPQAPTVLLTPTPGAFCVSVARPVAQHDGLVIGGGFASGRMWVAESHALALESRLRRAPASMRLVVRISRDGTLTPLDMLVDGEPYQRLTPEQVK
jgi:hypothetical protein